MQIPRDLEWQIRRAAFLDGMDHNDIVISLVRVFVADPETWLRLIQETSGDPGPAMKPWTRKALEAVQDSVAQDG